MVTTLCVVLYNFKALHNSILKIRYNIIFKDLLLPLLLVTLIVMIPINALNIILQESLFKLVVIAVTSTIFILSLSYLFVLTKQEKMKIKNIIHDKLLLYK